MTGAALLALVSHWRRHKVQLATLVLGLAMANALWSGVQAINAEARASYAAAAATLGQDRRDRLSAPEGVRVAEFVALRRAGYLVSPVVEGQVRRGDLRLRIVGLDPLTAPPDPALAPLAGDGESLAAFLSPEGLLLIAPEAAADARAAGDLPPVRVSAEVAPGTALTDVGTALRLLNRDRLSHLLVLDPQPHGLPPLEDATDLIRSAPDSGTDLGELTDSFHLNLTAFGLLSFGVGLFIVQSAIGLAFEQRRGTFRTLRALGLSLRRLMILLVCELAALALLAGGLGLGLGYAIAAALLPDVAGTLRGLYGASVSGELGFDPLWAASGLAITLAGTALAGAQALWKVAHMPLMAPAQPRAWALASARTLRWQGAAALTFLATAGALAALGSGLPAAFACLGALLLGAALALPPLLVGALRATQPLARGPVAEWLLADARQQVPALSLALMALLLALAANIGVGTMVGSFRTTFTGWLDQRLAAELYVTAGDAAEADRVRAVAEVAADAVLPIWSVEAEVAGRPTTVAGVADHATYRENWPLLTAEPRVWDRLAAGEVALINEQLWRRQGLTLGDPLPLGRGWTLPVGGVYSDYGNPEGQVMVGAAVLAERFPEAPQLRFALRVDPDRADAVADRLREDAGLAPDQVVNQAQVKALSLRVFDRTFVVTGALNLLTLGVAAFAMLTSLLTLSALRLPQLAPVWACGVRPARLGQLEVARTALLAALTWGLALPVGLALAWVLLTVVNVEAFGWRLPLLLFPVDWLVLLAAAIGAALLACAWPVGRLVRRPPADLLRVFAHDR